MRPARPIRGISGDVVSLDVPDGVWSWIEKCWAQDKDGRPVIAAVALGMRDRRVV